MAAIELTGVRKRYGQGPDVIQGIDLHVHDGEFMVFVGPSGCGKSTLLRMVAGLEDFSDGTLHIGGTLCNHVNAAQRGVAMVFQNYALYPHMTVRENMGFALKLAGVAKAQVRARVEHAAHILQLGALLERRPAAMSGGQRQRVAIGRAIVREPGVFLFDEPLSNLDAALRVQMRIEIARLHKELGTTMVYVTHDQMEAMTLGQRIAVFDGGRIAQLGAPLDLYEAPQNLFVAGFIGSPRMNLLGAQCQVRGSVRLEGGSLLELVPQCELPAGACTVGVRPEHVALCAPDEGLAAQVVLVEQLGDATLVHVQLRDGGQAVVARVAGVLRGVTLGQVLAVRWQAQHQHLFGADGQRCGLCPA